MQNPVEWKNPVIQCRITGFEYLLHDRLCRGRYFDLGSISYASFYEGGQTPSMKEDRELGPFSPPSFLGHYIGKYAIIFPEVSWFY